MAQGSTRMSHVNANQFPDVYTALGINVSKLGCIMLEVEPLQVTELVMKGKEDLYESKDPEKFWIAGAVAEHKAHVTLLYGLLEHGLTWKPLVDIVLADWTPPQLVIDSIGVFDSPFANEDYACIVAHIKTTPELLEGHARLELLPHVNTYLEYRPHLTLAYVKREAKDRWLSELGDQLNGTTLTVKNIDYGKRH